LWHQDRISLNPSRVGTTHIWHSQIWWLPYRTHSRWVMSQIIFSRRTWVIRFKHRETITTHKWFMVEWTQTISSVLRTLTRIITTYLWSETNPMIYSK
jgi:hypothetical protein